MRKVDDNKKAAEGQSCTDESFEKIDRNSELYRNTLPEGLAVAKRDLNF